MRWYAYIFILGLWMVSGCCKENPPAEYKPNANFISYYDKPSFYNGYWEKIDRDTFSSNDIFFEALDSTEKLDYEWHIGREIIKGQRVVMRNFEGVPRSTKIPIKLIVHYPDKKSDTVVRVFQTSPYENFLHYFDRRKYVFINDNDNKDTLRYEFKERGYLIGPQDTLIINGCKKIVNNKIISLHQMSFNYIDFDVPNSSNYCKNFFIADAFIKLDSKDVSKAKLRAKTGKIKGDPWVINNYSGHRIN